MAFEKSCIADRYNYLKNRFTADNPIIKVTGYLSVCTNGTANRLTDIVLLYNAASHRSWEGLKLFRVRVPLPSQDKSPLKNDPSRTVFFCFLKLKFKGL